MKAKGKPTKTPVTPTGVGMPGGMMDVPMPAKKKRKAKKVDKAEARFPDKKKGKK